MNVIGFYDKFDARKEGDEGFAWDEVLVLCRECAEASMSLHDCKDLGEVAAGRCNGCG